MKVFFKHDLLSLPPLQIRKLKLRGLTYPKHNSVLCSPLNDTDFNFYSSVAIYVTVENKILKNMEK